MNRKDYIIDTFSNNLGVKSVRVTHKPTGVSLQEDVNGISYLTVRDRLIDTLNKIYVYPRFPFK